MGEAFVEELVAFADEGKADVEEEEELGGAGDQEAAEWQDYVGACLTLGGDECGWEVEQWVGQQQCVE